MSKNTPKTARQHLSLYSSGIEVSDLVGGHPRAQRTIFTSRNLCLLCATGRAAEVAELDSPLRLDQLEQNDLTIM
jgi:hypothetical protein